MACEWGPIITMLTTAIGTLIGVYQEKRIRPLFDKCFHTGHSRYTGFINKYMGGAAILTVRIIAGFNLKNVDGEGDVSDPYAVVCVGTKKCSTETINDCADPVWNKGGPWEFEINTSDDRPENVLTITVFDSNYFAAHQTLGALTIPLGTGLSSGRFRKALNAGDGGELEFEISVQRVGDQQVVAE
eukprot:TRINITY_DN101_c0_g1_i1.p1 TRINITY_DN101_c0_g1~~TRINITY_DN101_c0_g1_i1.p1  ORF type:complete len:186 (+),score=14.04 TRINITY_DN101_c0_g1_i1:95-652(+)